MKFSLWETNFYQTIYLIDYLMKIVSKLQKNALQILREKTNSKTFLLRAYSQHVRKKTKNHITTGYQNRKLYFQHENKKSFDFGSCGRELFFMSMCVKFEYTGPFKTPWHTKCKLYLNSLAIQIFTKKMMKNKIKEHFEW